MTKILWVFVFIFAFLGSNVFAGDAVEAAFASKIKEHQQKETDYRNQAMNNSAYEKKAEEEHQIVDGLESSQARYLACKGGTAGGGCWGI